MEITLAYFDDCPNWKIVDAYLQQLVTEHRGVTIRYEQVDTPDAAERFGFRGSPTVLFDGVDPFASPDAPVGLSCRIYQTPDGPAGSPTLAQLRDALTSG